MDTKFENAKQNSIQRNTERPMQKKHDQNNDVII